MLTVWNGRVFSKNHSSCWRCSPVVPRDCGDNLSEVVTKTCRSGLHWLTILFRLLNLEFVSGAVFLVVNIRSWAGISSLDPLLSQVASWVPFLSAVSFFFFFSELVKHLSFSWRLMDGLIVFQETTRNVLWKQWNSEVWSSISRVA